MIWPDLFSRVLSSFLPPLLATPLPPFLKGTVQSLERGSSGMDLSTKFGKEIPSQNLREARSVANLQRADCDSQQRQTHPEF